MNSKRTILIVEDQAGFRMIYEDLLVDAGYQVICAEDGETGWNLAKEKKPSLVLLDLGLPKMDGFEVLRRMRADNETKDIPVIIFSVMGEQANVKRAMDMGANDYTIKGFYTPRQILSKIKSQLILFETMEDVAPYKIPMKAGGVEAAKFQDGIGLTQGYQCPHCDVEMVLEMFPDHVREGSHWFTSRLICPQCAKAV
jgi:DNA-binding response OmpR family regulator